MVAWVTVVLLTAVVAVITDGTGPTEALPSGNPSAPGEIGVTLSRYLPIVPGRLLDTRSEGEPPADGAITRLAVAGRLGVPADATAVALNVTATETTGPGFVTLWPAGLPRPEAFEPQRGTRRPDVPEPRDRAAR